jgi:hypothetical protein
MYANIHTGPYTLRRLILSMVLLMNICVYIYTYIYTSGKGEAVSLIHSAFFNKHLTRNVLSSWPTPKLAILAPIPKFTILLGRLLWSILPIYIYIYIYILGRLLWSILSDNDDDVYLDSYNRYYLSVLRMTSPILYL